MLPNYDQVAADVNDGTDRGQAVLDDGSHGLRPVHVGVPEVEVEERDALAHEPECFLALGFKF